MEKLEQQFALQKKINLLLTIGIVGLVAYLSMAQPVHTFEEISVERINIVEKSGLNRMVLANSDKSPGVDKFGKEVWHSGTPRPGMIFYNNEGTENGGFIFGGGKQEGEVKHGLHMSFDRYNQDQTLYMQHLERPGLLLSGLTVMDRPKQDLDFYFDKKYKEAKKLGDEITVARLEKQIEREKPFGARRGFYGIINGDAKLELHDSNGKKRIQMLVTEAGEAKLEFLNSQGEVILRLPEKKY
ncbi:MAG: hypothetical protein K0U59_07585 [Gammaproteobacteria bacterium]|nr:hypothetical protein [Gammaproteobacteria bacterium]